MRSLPGAPASRPGAVEEDDVGRMTGSFQGAAGGTRGAPGDCGPYPVNCVGGNI